MLQLIARVRKPKKYVEQDDFKFFENSWMVSLLNHYWLVRLSDFAIVLP